MNFIEFGQSIIEGFLSLPDKLRDRIPEGKRQIYLLILGGLFFFAICLIVISLVAGPRTTVSPQVSASGIPAEELFFPEEPDFLPPLILEREPRQPWDLQSLEFFWQDPRVGNEEKWREEIIRVVDRLMDGVP